MYRQLSPWFHLLPVGVSSPLPKLLGINRFRDCFGGSVHRRPRRSLSASPRVVFLVTFPAPVGYHTPGYQYSTIFPVVVLLSRRR
jgi:hypothetical protein